jgi:ribosomal protein S18 acetylase RimI-like enzyme
MASRKPADEQTSRRFVIEEIADVPASWSELLPLFEGQAEYHQPLLGLEPSPDWRELLAERFRTADNVVFLARVAGQPIGFLSASTDMEDRLWQSNYLDIDNVYVMAEWRGRGVARALLAQAEGWARRRGIFELQLGVLANNALGLAVWRQSGFQTVSYRMSRKVARDE